MDISSTQRLADGIIERRFSVPRAGGQPVPGVLWTREGAPSGTPLVLLGHGGGGSKDAPGNTVRRDYFTGERGIATAAIDAPGHGDRGLVRSITDAVWAELWTRPEQVLDEMTGDWGATLDALLALGEFDSQAVGYAGLSLGSVFGIPFVAAEPRIAAAVLGLCGVRRAPGVVAAALEDRRSARIVAAAPGVRCPVLYHVQWDDELFDRDGAFELYGMLGSPDKRLQSTPGPHGGVTVEARETMQAFLANRLAVPARA